MFLPFVSYDLCVVSNSVLRTKNQEFRCRGILDSPSIRCRGGGSHFFQPSAFIDQKSKPGLEKNVEGLNNWAACGCGNFCSVSNQVFFRRSSFFSTCRSKLSASATSLRQWFHHLHLVLCWDGDCFNYRLYA